MTKKRTVFLALGLAMLLLILSTAPAIAGTNTTFCRIGTPGDDTLDGGAGDDCIRGRDGDDTINGHAGDDCLYGENDEDDLNGNAGDDYLHGGCQDDNLDGGSGTDTCVNGEAHTSCETISTVPEFCSAK